MTFTIPTRLKHPHFIRRAHIAMIPLGLFGALARGESRAEMAALLALGHDANHRMAV